MKSSIARRLAHRKRKIKERLARANREKAALRMPVEPGQREEQERRNRLQIEFKTFIAA